MTGDGVVLYRSTQFHPGDKYTPSQNVKVRVPGVQVMILQVSIDDPALFSFCNDAGPLVGQCDRAVHLIRARMVVFLALYTLLELVE
eukprot:SAG11_NODE_2118_length_3791_cov_2.251625_3_plen_87_part_00